MLDIHSQISIFAYVAVSNPRTFFSVVPRLSSNINRLIQDHQLAIKRRIKSLNNEHFKLFIQGMIFYRANWEYCKDEERCHLQKYINVILKWCWVFEPEHMLLAINGDSDVLFLQLLSSAPADMITPEFWNFVIFKTPLSCLKIWRIVFNNGIELTLDHKISMLNRLSLIREKSPDCFIDLVDSLFSLGFTMFDLPAMHWHFMRTEGLTDRQAADWLHFNETLYIYYKSLDLWKTIFFILRKQYDLPLPPYTDPNRVETDIEAVFGFNFFRAFLNRDDYEYYDCIDDEILKFLFDMYPSTHGISKNLAIAIIDQLNEVDDTDLAISMIPALLYAVHGRENYCYMDELVQRLPLYVKTSERFLEKFFAEAYRWQSTEPNVWCLNESARRDGRIFDILLKYFDVFYFEYVKMVDDVDSPDGIVYAFKSLLKKKNYYQLRRLLKFSRKIKSTDTCRKLSNEFYQLITLFGLNESVFTSFFDNNYDGSDGDNSFDVGVLVKGSVFNWAGDDFVQAVFKEAVFHGYTDLVVSMMRNDASRSKMFPAFLDEMDALARAVKNEDMVMTIERER